MSDEEIQSKYPEFWNDFFSFSKDVRFPDGETGEEVKARQKSLLDDLVQRDEDVLLVSHEGYIRLLMCNLLDIPVFKRNLFKVDMCGIMEFRYDREIKSWIIELWIKRESRLHCDYERILEGGIFSETVFYSIYCKWSMHI